MTSYSEYDVAVGDGALHVGRWGEGPAVVLAAHGLTASHLHFAALADELGPDVTLLAPDLRGRGGSAGIDGPYGMAAHADDLAAVLDDAHADRAVVIGHSMGAFVAAVTADRHADRVSSVVLVDGGLPLDLGVLNGRDVEDVVRGIVGPALDRLRMTFASVPDYLDRWRTHPAFASDWNEHVERAFTYDLAGEPPQLTPSCRVDAVLADAASELQSDDVERALAGLTRPAVLVRAPRGILDETPPLYPDPVLADGRKRVPHLTDVLVPDVNHYTILFAERGAKAVADVVRAQLDRR